MEEGKTCRKGVRSAQRKTGAKQSRTVLNSTEKELSAAAGDDKFILIEIIQMILRLLQNIIGFAALA